MHIWKHQNSCTVYDDKIFHSVLSVCLFLLTLCPGLAWNLLWSPAILSPIYLSPLFKCWDHRHKQPNPDKKEKRCSYVKKNWILPPFIFKFCSLKANLSHPTESVYVLSFHPAGNEVPVRFGLIAVVSLLSNSALLIFHILDFFHILQFIVLIVSSMPLIIWPGSRHKYLFYYVLYACVFECVM